MTGNPDLFRAPRPWHVLLSPVVAILRLLGGSPVPGIALWALTVGVLVSALCWLVLARLSGRSRVSALAISLIVFMFLSQRMIVDAARPMHLTQLASLTPLLAGVLLALILRFGGAAKGWTVFANVFTMLLTVFLAAPLILAEYRVWRSPTHILEPASFPQVESASLPDIYVLILDGYGRADVLCDYYGFPNPLPSQLESLGFYVAHDAASNYAQTSQSLASSLNLDYLPALLEEQPTSDVTPRRRFGDLIANNRTFATLATAGYRIRSYSSEYSLVKPANVDEHPHPWLYLTEFEYNLYDTSMLPLLSVAAGFQPGAVASSLHRRHITWTLDHLERELPRPGDPPTLVFAHLLIPHPPFSFEPDGSPLRTRLPARLDDGSHWKALAANTGENYEAGYIKAVRFLNKRLLEIVGAVLTHSAGRDVIIYLQGDHGPGSRLDWNDPVRTDYRERLGILLAARLPRGAHTAMSADITPVNAVRVLMNAALGAKLPLLDDRAYFSPWRDPLQFIDVTDQVSHAKSPQ